jgi:dCMP deaminase
MNPTKWDLHYLNLAKEVATWSKDPSTKIGAVAVGSRRQILATGYNGFPRGINDYKDRLETKEIKYKYVVHGEMNCIYNATLNGVSLDNADLYVYGLPVCSECAKGIIQVGIKRVFMCYPETINVKWEQSRLLSNELLFEAGIEFHEVEL